MSLEQVEAARVADEVHVVVSDLHLSAGPRIWLRQARHAGGGDHRLVEQENTLEDFPHDAVFFSFVRKVTEEYRGADQIVLRLLGDIFDPLAIPWRGRFVEPPYEAIAIRKIQIIMRGHREFFDALVWFIRQPNGYLDFFVGNHDPCIVWPGVQEAICRRLAGNDAALRGRIRFFDHHKNFEDVHRGVHYYHGMNADAHTSMDPHTIVKSYRFGIKVNRPTITIPYSSYLTVDLVNKIKLRNPLVGRLRGRVLWKNAALHMWSWNVYAGLALIGAFFNETIATAIGARGWRRFSAMMRMVIETFTDDSVGRVDRRALATLRERNDVQVVVRGHSHAWRLVSTEDGTYVNTGTWSKSYREVEPTVSLSWKRFRWFELLPRTIGHFFSTGELLVGKPFVQVTRVLAFIAALTVFLIALFFKSDGTGFSLQSVSLLRVPFGILVSTFSGVLVLRILGAKPTFVPHSKFTCAVIEHAGDDPPRVSLLEFLPEENRFRECG